MTAWPFAFKAVCLLLDFLILSFPQVFSRFIAGTIPGYLFGTAVLLAINVALLALPHRRLGTPAATEIGSRWLSLAAGLAGVILVATGCAHWIERIFTVPFGWGADMLVVIQEGIKSLSRGRDPYTLYHVPWEATLPYGPVLWMPYIAPYALRMDLRFVTVAGPVFLALVCAVTAAAFAYYRRWMHAVVVLAVELAICFNPALDGYIVIGHTPSYWPLILVFCYLVSERRLRAAAILLGLLVAARTTMIAIVPVFFILCWRDDRPSAVSRLAYVGVAALAPFLPFAIWDPGSLWYAMYGSYQNVIKGVVWHSADGGVDRTFGTTGYLLSRGWDVYVEPLQLAVMLGFYALAWRSVRHGAQALLWMMVGLLAFSMTCIWPVGYIYFDVFLFLTAAVLLEDGILHAWVARIGLVPCFAAAAVSVSLLLLIVARSTAGARYEVDVGTFRARDHLMGGFSHDETAGDITFRWVTGTTATVRLPRVSWSDGRLVVRAMPLLPEPESTQAATAVLNARVLGTRSLGPGWSTVSFAAPAEFWRVGFNQLELHFTYALSPRELGRGADPRPLAAAIDKIEIVRP